MGDEGELAVEALDEVLLDHTVGQMKDYVRRASQEPEEWRRAASSSRMTIHLTVDELAALGAEFEAILTRYRPRIDDPSLRPEGSRPVRMFVSTWLPRPLGREE